MKSFFTVVMITMLLSCDADDPKPRAVPCIGTTGTIVGAVCNNGTVVENPAQCNSRSGNGVQYYLCTPRNGCFYARRIHPQAERRSEITWDIVGCGTEEEMKDFELPDCYDRLLWDGDCEC